LARPLGRADRAVLGSVEHLGRAAEHLHAAICLDLFGTAVPRSHAPFTIENKDRVAADIVHELLEPSRRQLRS
jgi:hypothetical protein